MLNVKESDLFEPLKLFMIETVGCSKVYAEVEECDVLAVCGPVNIAVETKTCLNFKVIDQAVNRKWIAQYIYIAVPKPKEIHRIVRSILEQYGIGLLIYENGSFRIAVKASYNRYAKKPSEVRAIYIKDYHESQTGGVKSGQHETDYSIMIKNIRRILEIERRFGNSEGWVTIDKILEDCETHYRNPKPSVMATLKKSWNRAWCETMWVDGKFCARMKSR